MISFAQFLKEETEKPANSKEGKLTHLRHLEDEVLHGGHEGIGRADQFLQAAHEHLQGKDNDTHFSTKYDGAPSIVYGKHPKTGKFFVATKSAFNKDPKINYTDKDIEANHGHAPGLVAKLKEALHHLPKIMPKHGGVYQGDLMYGHGDVSTKGGQHHFTPNTLTYSSPADSAEGRRIKGSKLGIVTHTEYKGKGDLENMKAGVLTPESREKFKQDPDVNHIDPTEHPNPANYTSAEKTKFEEAREAARQAYKKMRPEAMETMAGHGTDMEAHVNNMIKTGGDPSVDGYIKHLNDRHDKEIAKLKRPETVEKKSQAHADVISHIVKHKKDFQNALEVHKNLQKAKDVLTHVMAKNSKFGHSIGGEATAPEGAVGVDKEGNMTKFVDRKEFSRQNFLKGKMQAKKNAEESGAKPEEKHHTIWFGRGQPITKGHEQGIKKALENADKTKGTHSIVFSHSNDSKNPLTPEQKLKHAKRAFPGANVSTSTPTRPNILHQAAEAHAAGATHLHVVAGSDRVKQYQDLLDKYNGQTSAHGHYNFKSIKVHSAGSRDPDAEGTEGISGTKMRAAAVANDRKTFHAGAPDTMSPKEKDEMMKDVQSGMPKPKPVKPPTKAPIKKK
jgi:hypothetical protein